MSCTVDSRSDPGARMWVSLSIHARVSSSGARLNDALPLLQAVDPADLNATLNTLATALEGRGAEIAGTLTQLDGYLKKLNPSVPKLMDAASVPRRLSELVEDQTPFNRRYDPAHPDADKDGFVAMPNVSVPEQMVDMLSATRAYQANLTAIGLIKDLISRAMELGK